MGPQTDSEILELFGEEPLLVSTLEKDTCKTREEAMLEIYRKLRPGGTPHFGLSGVPHQQPFL